MTKAMTKIKPELIDDEKISDYLESWRDSEQWNSFNVLLDRGELQLACEYIRGTGAIDSSQCFEQYKEIEQQIEHQSDEYRKLSKTKQNIIFKRAFKDCSTFACNECNHVSFLISGNDKLYSKELETCWHCQSIDIVKGKI